MNLMRISDEQIELKHSISKEPLLSVGDGVQETFAALISHIFFLLCIF
jgi:hypothetical protein